MNSAGGDPDTWLKKNINALRRLKVIVHSSPNKLILHSILIVSRQARDLEQRARRRAALRERRANLLKQQQHQQQAIAQQAAAISSQSKQMPAGVRVVKTMRVIDRTASVAVFNVPRPSGKYDVV